MSDIDLTEPVNCPECRKAFTRHRRDQAFCSAACNKAAEVRELRRVRRLYRALYHWRLNRYSGGWGLNMRFVCREIAAWIREDRDHQRPPPPPHNHDADRGHERPAKPVSLAPKKAFTGFTLAS